MKLIETSPGALKGLRRRAEGSLQRLPEFVGALIPGDAPIRAASAIVQGVVFEPKHLESLLIAQGLPTSYGVDWTIAAAGHEESAVLLEALLGDWLDFYSAPEPKHILLSADHDDYTTVLHALGIREIADYARSV